MHKYNLAGCAFVQDNSILLLRRIKTGWYELPGGKIKNNESAEQAAIREIKEELGTDIKLLDMIGSASFEENGYIMGYVWFKADFLPKQIPIIAEPNNFDDLKYIKLAELNRYRLSPNMLNLAKKFEVNNKFL